MQLIQSRDLCVTHVGQNLATNNMLSQHVATCWQQFQLSSWYPWPMQVIHENGGEFTGFAFQQILHLLNIKPVPTTNKTLQANVICKWMHLTVATVLNTLLLANPPQSCCQAALLVDDALATALHALWSIISTELQAMPGGLAFCWDMFLNIPLLADWQAILAQREQLVHDALLYANKKHINFDYQVVKRSSSMTKGFRAILNHKLQSPLTFFGSILTALWQFACGVVFWNTSMFAAPCHKRSPHLCNLIQKSCFFLIDYQEGECYAQLHL